jgi:hypothetical protein
MRLFVVAAAAATVFSAAAALAKLPPPSDEAKAKAAETAAKAAWSDKVALYELSQSMDKVAAGYRAHAVAAGHPASTPEQTPACVNPGAFAPPVTPAASKPLEASEAHSPPGAATSPPSNKATSAEMTGPPK